MLLTTALTLNRLGLACLPIVPRSKQPLIKWQRYQQEPPTLSDYEKWFRGNTGIAVICGKVSNNLVVLDFDTVPAFVRARNRYPILRETYTIRTGRGFHCYLFVDELPARTLSIKEVDVKATGYVVTAPSIHPSGVRYEVVEDRGIVRVKSVVEVGIVELETPNISMPPIATTTLATPLTGNTPNIRRSLIAEIKARVKITSLFSVVPEMGVKKMMVHCPTSAHPNGDRNPSLVLDVESNRCRCFKPSCPLHTQHGNDVIDAYAILNNLPLKNAIAELANELGL